jgi:hypothetical protein
LVRQEHRLAA